MLKIENLNYSVDNKSLLKNISCCFKRGKLTGILGANGSGKSTFLKSIIGFLNIDSGTIILDEKDISNLSREELSKLIAYLPQKTNRISGFTGKEFLSLGRIPHIKNIFKGLDNEDKKEIDLVIERLNLLPLVDKPILNLSGGEYQQLLLGRVFVQNGEVLILDEPTSALDINHSLTFLTYLKKELIDKDKIGIIVIHDINLASLFCDNIIFLKNGEIRYLGNPKEVLTEDILEDIYGYLPKIFKSENDIYVVPKKEVL